MLATTLFPFPYLFFYSREWFEGEKIGKERKEDLMSNFDQETTSAVQMKQQYKKQRREQNHYDLRSK